MRSRIIHILSNEKILGLGAITSFGLGMYHFTQSYTSNHADKLFPFSFHQSLFVDFNGSCSLNCSIDDFAISIKELSNDISSFLSQPAAKYSDHLPISDVDAMIVSWNTLQQCNKFTIKGVDKYNNAFGKAESSEEYQKRRNQSLRFLTENYVTKLNFSAQQLSPSVICLQEIQGEDKEIEAELKNGFQVARLLGKDNTLSKIYHSKGCKLVMLHNSSVKPVEACDLSHLNLDHNERYQAVKFMDIEAKQEFIVVNVHQDYSSVKFGEKPGLKNLKLIQQAFSHIPCLITGDFNTSNLPLNREAGKIAKGVNTNLIWDEAKGGLNDHLGSCDHIIMNASYCEKLLPALQQRMKSAYSQFCMNRYKINSLINRNVYIFDDKTLLSRAMRNKK